MLGFDCDCVLAIEARSGSLLRCVVVEELLLTRQTGINLSSAGSLYASRMRTCFGLFNSITNNACSFFFLPLTLSFCTCLVRCDVSCAFV